MGLLTSFTLIMVMLSIFDFRGSTRYFVPGNEKANYDLQFLGEEDTLSNNYFSLRISHVGITNLKRTNDVFDTDYIMEGKVLGDVVVRYRMADREWKKLRPPRWRTGER